VVKSRPRHSKPDRRNVPAPQPTAKTPTLTPRRKWLFRLVAVLLVPVLVLAIEAALRLANYGYRTSFFEKIRIGQRTCLVDNENFSLRFFPPQLMRWAGPVLMDADKPPDTWRIFILGESAAQGDPEPAYGAGRYLEVLLRERFPGQRFEVVNVAVTAINSHVIVPIARECAEHQGDLWIVYMGNNEMVGPFGAATVFGAQAPPWWLVRLNLAEQQTKIGQWVTAQARKRESHGTDSSWGGMQMFLKNQLPPDDPRREVVYRNFQRNLDDILRAGLDSGAKIILNTVAVNLKDCPPFGSLSESNLPAAERTLYERNFLDGCRAEEHGRFSEATQQFEDAAKIEPKIAELQFRMGRCLLSLTNVAAAREHLQLACDEDTLPFRADSRINDIIRRAGARAGAKMVLFDAAAMLETDPPGIGGQDLFYEHVHLNFTGNYRLARAWADRVEQFLQEASRHRAIGSWASQETCERLLGLTDWNRNLVIKSVTGRLQQPPFSSQLDNDRRLATFRARMTDLGRRMDEPGGASAREIYAEALKRAPEDYMLHENFAEFLNLTGDNKQATTEWLRAQELSPRNPFASYQAGHLLALQGRWVEAQNTLSNAITVHPRYVEAWLELGAADLAQKKFELAMECYDRARRLQPADPHIYFEIGRAFSLSQRSPESIENFRHALALKPDYWEAHYALGGELALHGQIIESKGEFEQTIRLEPDFAPAYLNLGVALLKTGDPDEAARQFEETLRRDPNNQFAKAYLSQIRAASANHRP
jgi:tetratricopeptide (TPR) repeat protein